MNRTKAGMVGLTAGFEGGAAPVETSPAAPPSGVTSGGSPAPQTGAGEASPTPASPASAPAGSGRTYREDEVQGMIRDRVAKMQSDLAPWKEFGDPREVRAQIERAKKIEAAMRGDAPAQPSPEERELRELLTKQFPGIDKVSNVEQRLQAIEQANQAARAAEGRGVIAKLAGEKLGVSDAKALKVLEGAVAASIGEDPAALEAWSKGDMSVVAKHFETVLSTALDPLLKSASARYSGGKAKDMAEVPPSVPRGGVQAPVSNDRKLTADERREAAWKHLQDLEGRG